MNEHIFYSFYDNKSHIFYNNVLLARKLESMMTKNYCLEINLYHTNIYIYAFIFRHIH